MIVSYEKLNNLLNQKGESLHSLHKKGILTDYASRLLSKGDYVNVKYLAQICRHFDVPIEEVVEVTRD